MIASDGKDVAVSFGATIKLSTGSTLRLVKLIRDNRCPLPPVRCAQSGLATLEVLLTPPSGDPSKSRLVALSLPGVHEEWTDGTFLLQTGETNVFTDDGVAWLLVRLDPMPTIDTGKSGVDTASYRAVLRNAGAFIGVAKLRPSDQAIVLDLDAHAGKNTGHAQIIYPPDHSEYQKLLLHLGGLNQNQEKFVLPWR